MYKHCVSQPLWQSNAISNADPRNLFPRDLQWHCLSDKEYGWESKMKGNTGGTFILEFFFPFLDLVWCSPPTLAPLSIAFIPTQAGTALIHSMLWLCNTRGSPHIYMVIGGLCMALLSLPPFIRASGGTSYRWLSHSTHSYATLVMIGPFGKLYKDKRQCNLLWMALSPKQRRLYSL